MTLFAVHVQGPDEIIAAPSEREAEALAVRLNIYFAEIKRDRGPNYPSVNAVVIKYPYTAASHAEQISNDWADHAKFIGPVDVEEEPERDTRTIDMFAEGT